MAKTKRTYYKALLLLILFSMNTLVSFACSFSDLVHSLHHHNSSATLQHEHANGEKHVHAHDGNHHDHAAKEEPPQQDCCSGSVAVQLVEKSVSRSIDAPRVFFVNAFLLAYTATVDGLFVPEQSFAPDYVRWRLPATIPDLRIVIQSFQI